MQLIGILTLVLSFVAVITTSDLTDGTRKCAGTLYKELIRTQPNQNILFSPLTVQTLMSMIASGVRNESAEVIREIRTALSLSDGKASREADFENLLHELKSDNRFDVFNAKKMYFKAGYSIKKWYRQIVHNIYKAEFKSVNFENPLDTTRRINEWVTKKTDNKITNFLNQDDITTNTQNVLISTLYLRGTWDKTFSVDRTTLQNFYGVNINGGNETKTVQMMFSNYTQDYFEDTDAQYLRIDLKREYSFDHMVFVLPNKQRDLHSLEQNIPKLLNDIEFVYTRVSVSLPKFSLSTDMKLKSTLQNIGIRRLFDDGTELAGLQYSGHNGHVKLSDVTQKAVLAVNEWGCNKYSRVQTYIVYEEEPNNEPKIFTADRPFFFYIIASKAIVFAGRVMQV